LDMTEADRDFYSDTERTGKRAPAGVSQEKPDKLPAKPAKKASGKPADGSGGRASGKTVSRTAAGASGKTVSRTAAGTSGKSDSRRSTAARRTDRTAGRRQTAGNNRSGIKRTGRQPLPESFSHAFDGILIGTGERNMRIHMGFALLVVIFGLLLQISVTEWCLCFVLFGLIMGLELVNTAVEAVVDLVTEEYHPLAKRAKDAAAGAVLIAAVMAAVTGLIIFIPRLLYALRLI